MLLSLKDTLYVLALAVLAGLRWLLGILYELIFVSVHLGFLAVAYVVVRVSLGVRELVAGWRRPG